MNANLCRFGRHFPGRRAAVPGAQRPGGAHYDDLADLGGAGASPGRLPPQRPRRGRSTSIGTCSLYLVCLRAGLVYLRSIPPIGALGSLSSRCKAGDRLQPEHLGMSRPSHRCHGAHRISCFRPHAGIRVRRSRPGGPRGDLYRPDDRPLKGAMITLASPPTPGLVAAGASPAARPAARRSLRSRLVATHCALSPCTCCG
jgi:hypothetical protein